KRWRATTGFGLGIRSFLAEEHRQPHGRLIWRRPLDPMLPMGLDQNVIAGPHLNRFTILEKQFGFALNHNDPLVFVLIVPEALGRDVSRGYDPLDADVLVLSENRDEFLGESS